MATKRLEDLIKSYLNKKPLSRDEAAYRSWAKKNGITADLALAAELSAAHADYKKSLSNHGSRAESLASAGLMGSGYADFLSTGAAKALSDRIRAADKGYSDREAASKSGYSKHLNAEAAARSKLISTAKSKINSEGLVKYEDAYGKALELGLKAEDAEKIARDTTTEMIGERRLKVISAIVNKRYTGKQAKDYALSLGLPDELAEELAELARKTNQEVKLGNEESYLDYLKKLAAEERAKAK